MRKGIQFTGILIGLVAIALILAAIFTTQWLSVNVDTEAIGNVPNNSLAHYTRDRGIYKECWSEEKLTQAIKNNEFYASKLCLYLDVDVLSQSSEEFNSYKSRAALLVSVWAMLAVAGLMMVLSLILSLYSVCNDTTTYQWKGSCKAASILMFFSALFTVLAIALFHGYVSMEMESVTDPDGKQAPYLYYFPSDYPAGLNDAITRSYGYSYALVWLSVACQLLAAILFAIIAWCYTKASKPPKTIYSKPASNYGTASRNPAYDIVEEKIIVAPPQVYVVPDDYYAGRGTYDPYRTGQPKSAYSPQFSFERGWQMQ